MTWTVSPDTRTNIDAILASVELPARREYRRGAKLTDSEVEAIKQSLADGEQGQVLAQRYGVSKATISGIKRGTRWNPKVARADTVKPLKGKKGNFKLTAEVVVAIKNGLRDGLEGQTLATLYDVSPSTISRIKNGSRWPEVQQ